MRWIGYGACLLALLALIGISAQAVVSRWPSREAAASNAELAGRRSVFVLSQQEWTDFALPPQTSVVRISSRLTLPADLTERFVNYGIVYRLADQAESVYHLRSRAPQGSEPRRRRADGQLLSRQRNFYLDTQLEKTSVLQLRLVDDPSVPAWVSVEVASKVDRSAGESRLLWQRLRGSVRSDLARASITPVNLLARDELDRLLQHGWQPLGPEGVAGRDYRAETTYAMPRPMVDASSESLVGAPIGPGKHLVFSIGEKQSLQVDINADDGGQLELWQLSPSGQQLMDTIEFDRSGRWLGEAEGTLQLVTSRPARVQVSALDAGTSLTADFGAAPHFKLSQDPVRYALAEPGLTLRVDLRSIDSTEHGRTAVGEVVRFRWLGTDRAGTLTPAFAASTYDRLQSPRSLDGLSERVRYFLTAPAAATGIEFSASSPVLLAVANRPQSLAWQRAADTVLDQPAVPAWFALYPVNEAQLLASDRRLLVRRQAHPDAAAPDRQDQRFVWQSLRTQRPQVQQQLMTPATFTAGAASAFVALEPGRNTIRFVKDSQPQLLYRRANAAQQRVAIRYAGGEIGQSIVGTQGKLDLPTEILDSDWLELSGAQADWWVNSVDGPGQGLRRRTVYSLSERPLTLWFDKRTEGVEVINLEAFVSRSGGGPSLVASLTVPDSPLIANDHTIRRRQLLLASPEQLGRAAWRLGRPEAVTEAQRGVVVLGEDVPAGRYALQLAWQGAGSGYVAAYQLQRGLDLIARYRSEDLDS